MITGYAILGEGVKDCGYAESTVEFYELSDGLIKEYVATGLPLDKAGSYGVQDGFPIVKKVTGSRENVIGLPIDILNEKLKNYLGK